MNTVLLRISFLAATASVTLGCQPSAPAAKPESPAKVAHAIDESSLNTITLSEKAYGRLGIETKPLKIDPARQRKRTLGGEVVIPPGRAVIVSAPIAGTLSPPAGARVPLPGSRVEAGTAIFDFVPLLSPERDVLAPADRVRVAQSKADIAIAQIEAKRQVAAAEAQVQASVIAHQRAVELLESKAGSQRTVDETYAARRIAEEALTAAEMRNKFLASVELDSVAGEQQPKPIATPVSGILQRIDAAPGETVTAGKPLFQVAQLDTIWIRVPVYAGQRQEINTAQPAEVTEFGQSQKPSRPAKYADAPPSADALAATIDLFYELDNSDQVGPRLHPGQRLSVSVPLAATGPALVVPAAAILYDIHGGTWVYEETAPRTFVRRRVQISYTDHADAILASGPSEGAKIVTAGAAELFGTEFGIGK